MNKRMICAILALTIAFAACNKAPAPFTDLNAISTHLAKAKSGTLDKPVAMIVNIPLGDMTNSGSGWQRLLMIIENAGKNVEIDLSACQMAGTEFNPFSQVSNGKFFVVSLVLPTAAKSIIGNRETPSFSHFYNLRSVKAEEVTSIGRNAFKECTSLNSVDFPVGVNIAEGAFNGCTGLEKVSVPLVTGIGNDAFNNCTSLAGINIPLATSIGDSAFDNCTSMTSVSFPASATVTNNPFRGCSSLASFSLNGVGDLGVIEDGRALVRSSIELIAYPCASGSIVMNNITVIGRSAFNGNAGLTGVSFPTATNIGIRSFRSCTSLISANFPAATAISLGAFENTGTTALTITLGNKAPTVGGSMFAGVTGEKPVIVRVPADATGYGQSPVNATARSWGNYFRGGDWSRSENWWGEVSYNRTAAPNTNIELIIEFMADDAAMIEEIVS